MAALEFLQEAIFVARECSPSPKPGLQRRLTLTEVKGPVDLQALRKAAAYVHRINDGCRVRVRRLETIGRSLEVARFKGLGWWHGRLYEQVASSPELLPALAVRQVSDSPTDAGGMLSKEVFESLAPAEAVEFGCVNAHRAASLVYMWSDPAIVDEWSRLRLIEDLHCAYRFGLHGESNDEATRPSFLDFSARQREMSASESHFWLGQWRVHGGSRLLAPPVRQEMATEARVSSVRLRAEPSVLIGDWLSQPNAFPDIQLRLDALLFAALAVVVCRYTRRNKFALMVRLPNRCEVGYDAVGRFDQTQLVGLAVAANASIEAVVDDALAGLNAVWAAQHVPLPAQWQHLGLRPRHVGSLLTLDSVTPRLRALRERLDGDRRLSVVSEPAGNVGTMALTLSIHQTQSHVYVEAIGSDAIVPRNEVDTLLRQVVDVIEEYTDRQNGAVQGLNERSWWMAAAANVGADQFIVDAIGRVLQMD